MHGLRWRTAHASSIDEKGLIYISLRQLPPRLVRVLLVYIWVNYNDLHCAVVPEAKCCCGWATNSGRSVGQNEMPMTSQRHRSSRFGFFVHELRFQCVSAADISIAILSSFNLFTTAHC